MITFSRILCLISLAAVLGCGSRASWAENTGGPADLPSAAACIEKYIAACGGPSLAKVKTEHWKGTLVRGNTGKVPFECTAKAPGRWLYNQTFAWGDQVSYGFDGSAGWVQDAKGASRMSAEQLADLRLLLDPQAPLKLRELYPEMKVTGSEKIDTTEAIVVLAKARDGTGTELVFDRTTGFLLRAGDIRFEDFRAVGDVKRPYKITLGKDEGESHVKMTMTVTDIQQNLGVDDSVFEMPTCTLPPKESPLFKRRKTVEVSAEAMDACVGTYQSPQNPNLQFIITREKNHLMFERAGSGQKIEIRPQSETDYFIEFPGVDFHFVKDASGKVTHFETGTPAFKVPKVK